MIYLLLVILILIIFYFLDILMTFIYCKVHENRVDKGGVQSKLKDEREYKFPQKHIKQCIHIYAGWIRYKLIRLGKIPCHAYRKFILKHIYRMKIANTAVIYGGFEIRSPWNIFIDDGTIIGDESKLDGRNGIIIGKNVNFSTGVWIWTEQHDVNDPYFQSNDSGGKVTIDDRAWVSSRVTILPKVHIEEGAVIAAGAVVTKNCSKYGIYAGIPAKKISERNNDLEYNFTGRHEAFY